MKKLHETLALGRVHAMDAIAGLLRLRDHSVAMVFADLPYGQTMHGWDSPVPIVPLWIVLRRVCRLRAALVFSAIHPFTALLVASNTIMFRHAMVWEKNKPTGHLNANRQPLRSHEDLLVFARETPNYRVQKTTGHSPMHAADRRLTSTCYGGHGSTPSEAGSTLRYPTSILRIPVVNNDDPDRIHPSQKPVALVEWFVKTYTRRGDLVVDPTAGSGTTIVAAERLGRRAVGFDLDSAMVEKANARIERARSEKKTR